MKYSIEFLIFSPTDVAWTNFSSRLISFSSPLPVLYPFGPKFRNTANVLVCFNLRSCHCTWFIWPGVRCLTTLVRLWTVIFLNICITFDWPNLIILDEKCHAVPKGMSFEKESVIGLVIWFVCIMYSSITTASKSSKITMSEKILVKDNGAGKKTQKILFCGVF